MAAYSPDTAILAGIAGPPQALKALRVTSSFFDVLRLPPAEGRRLNHADDLPNGPPVCLLSWELRQSLFGGQPVVGTTIRVDGRSTEIVGVLPPSLTAPWGDRQLVLPRVYEDSELTGPAVATGAVWLSVVARVRPGSTLQVQQDLAESTRAFASAFTGRSDAAGDLTARPFEDQVVGDRRAPLTYWSARSESCWWCRASTRWLCC